MHDQSLTANLPAPADLARWTLTAQHPLTHQWCDSDRARLAQLADEHEFDLRLATDLDLATRRTALAPGHEPDQLLNRWVTVSPDLAVMLSIRFEGGDPTKPFVDASALSRPLRQDDLPRLGAAAADAFGTFAPRYLRLWSAAPTDSFTGTNRDKRFLAAPIRDLAAPDTATTPDELSLATTTDLARWDDAVAAYAAVDSDHPAHPAQASIQSRDDLQDSIEAGTLFDVLVARAWAGWISATTDSNSLLGLPGYEVQEIILAPAYRGRGYGTHLHRLLARHLPDPDGVLIGTIHADNRGAIAAAHDAGRHDVGGWLQLALPAHPSVAQP